MFEHYIMEFEKVLDNIMPAIINEKYFLCLMGSIFLLGIVTKWIVVADYERLIRKAENMTHPKNATLRQIKMKFDSVKQVNGQVANPMLLVKRHLNRCRVGMFSLNRLNHIINWCTILIISISGIVGLELYRTKAEYMVIMGYVSSGCFFGFALEMINRCTMVKDRQTELAYVIVDFLENGTVQRDERQMETLIDLIPDGDSKKDADIVEESPVEVQEAQILNQVIGEFLQ